MIATLPTAQRLRAAGLATCSEASPSLSMPASEKLSSSDAIITSLSRCRAESSWSSACRSHSLPVYVLRLKCACSEFSAHFCPPLHTASHILETLCRDNFFASQRAYPLRSGAQALFVMGGTLSVNVAWYHPLAPNPHSR